MKSCLLFANVATLYFSQMQGYGVYLLIDAPMYNKRLKTNEIKLFN